MTFKSLVQTLLDLIGIAIPIVFALSLIALLAGVVVLMYHVGGEDKGKTGKQMLLWGTIFLTVAACIWSIIKIIRVTFGLT